jgi:creatinine amidohydrolase
LTSVVAALLEDLVRHGARKFVFLNGHLENAPYVYDALESILGIHPAPSSSAKALFINWWELVTVDDKQALFPPDHPAWGGDHASFAETSLMLALRPDLVRFEQAVDATRYRVMRFDVVPAPPDTVPESGVLWRATLASVEVGKQLVQLLEDRIGRAITEELG